MKNLTYGMVGGAHNSFIGVVHRASMALAGGFTPVCGCFSRNWGTNVETGQGLGIDGERIYKDYNEMAKTESAKADKPDFFVVTTRNHDHFGAVKALLEHGFHVMCEKPLTTNVKDALELKKIAEDKSLILGVSYTYSGHVMAMDARNLIKAGKIGTVLMVMGEYPQDWLLSMAEGAGHGIDAWRIEPSVAGGSNAVGDIGSHIEHTVAFMTGLKIKKLCAVMDKCGEGTELDNNSVVTVKYDNGATGCYWCSQVAAGYDNALKVRIFGTEGSLEFEQEASNYLLYTKKDGTRELRSRGRGYVTEAAAAFSTVPSGHPEGYHNAFANIYRAFGDAVIDSRNGVLKDLSEYDFPSVDEGVDGVRFIEKCLESAAKGSVWVDL
jgi:predicted dehydrogenase